MTGVEDHAADSSIEFPRWVWEVAKLSKLEVRRPLKTGSRKEEEKWRGGEWERKNASTSEADCERGIELDEGFISELEPVKKQNLWWSVSYEISVESQIDLTG